MTKQFNTDDRTTLKKIARILLWVFASITVLSVGAAAAVAAVIYQAQQDLPTFDGLKNAPTGTTVRYFSQEGEMIFARGPEYGEWIPYEQIPEEMKKAIIAVEDKRYHDHFGVDPVAMGRAAYLAFENRGTNRRMQGASTITQQVARTIFLNQNYNIRRKVEEIIIALALETKFTKDQILEIYLNKVYFGGGAYGIDAASRTFFSHDAKTLTTEEAALLAGVVKAPSDYAPTANEKTSVDRMRTVLRLMKETGQDLKANPQAEAPVISISRRKETFGTSRYFIDWVEPQLEQIAPEVSGQVDVYTTINLGLQVHAQETVLKQTPAKAEAGLIAIETDGAIRSMVGGRDYAVSSFNRATQAKRQPGSSFKLFVYLTALESGFGPRSLVHDGPIQIAGWTPQNSSGRYSGDVPLSTAFAFSLNTAAVRLSQKTSPLRVSQMAERMGISTGMKIDPSISLGTSEVRLIDMTRAYAQVANEGRIVVPYGISKITVNNRVIYEHQSAGDFPILSRDVAASMTSLMREVVARGTGTAANPGRVAAGKTGTTNENRDGWFVGFSSGVVTGVWVGRDDAKPVPGLEGGKAPARIFGLYMREAIKGKSAGFETVEAPEVKGRNLTGGITVTKTQKPTGPSSTETIAPISTPAPAVPPQLTERKQGQSRAIRPQD